MTTTRGTRTGPQDQEGRRADLERWGGALRARGIESHPATPGEFVYHAEGLVVPMMQERGEEK